MTLQEILKSQGLTEEQVTKIVGEMKQNKIFTASEENLDVRYGKLKTDHDALTQKASESEKLIAELQKASKDNEGIQAKIAEYEATIKKKDEELQKTKTDNAIKVALLEAKAKDVDYLTFKLKESHPDGIKLDDNGNIKGLEDIMSGLKTQFPAQFDTASNGGKNVDERKLGDDQQNHDDGITKEAFDKMGYQDRLKVKQESPELYAQLTGKTTDNGGAGASSK